MTGSETDGSTSNIGVASNAATTTATSMFKPKEPKFGGLEQVGTDNWVT